MCARYTLRRGQLARAVFEALRTEAFEEFSERPRFNLAPRQRLPIVRTNSQGQRVLDVFQWGLIPRWAKALPKVRPVNIRAETLSGSGVFREPFSRRRCLVPADGFYEWKGSRPPREPWFLRMKDDSLFAFGGLWERWHGSGENDPAETFTIITTAPNAVVSAIHDRMPLIVHPREYARWLDPDVNAESAADLLLPYPPEGMEAFAVSLRVNAASNDGPELIEPLSKDNCGPMGLPAEGS